MRRAIALVAALGAVASIGYAKGTTTYGGSGPDLKVAEQQCNKDATAQGWTVKGVDKARVTGPSTAEIRFNATGIRMRNNVTCTYNSANNTTTLK